MQNPLNSPQAALFHGSGRPLSLIALTDAQASANTALVHVEACTICSSDLHTVAGRRVSPAPSVLGHEAIGHVARLPETWLLIDPSGKPVDAGQRVVWGVAASCGQCLFCTTGLPQKCNRLLKYGHAIHQPGSIPKGGLSQRVELVAGTPVVPLTAELPAGMACLAACAGATVAGAMRLVGHLTDKHVLILGGGVLGAIACRMAFRQGARAVVCVEPDSFRRKRAIAFGASLAIDPNSDNALEEIRARANQGLGVDTALDFSGARSAFDLGLASLRTGGVFLLAGAVFPAGKVEIEPEQIIRRMLTITGLHNYAPEDLQTAVAFLEDEYRQSPEVWQGLVGQSFPLDSVDAAFAWAAENQGVRALVQMA
jgi:alcohol dehydrogenase